MSLDAIEAEVAALGAPLVLLTGGEPMLQKDIGVLAQRLLDSGHQVMIETSGPTLSTSCRARSPVS